MQGVAVPWQADSSVARCWATCKAVLPQLLLLCQGGCYCCCAVIAVCRCLIEMQCRTFLPW